MEETARCDARAVTGTCWARSCCYSLSGGTSILVVRELGLIDLVPTGISSCLVAVVNGQVHLVTMAVALMAAALRSRLSLSPLLLTALLGDCKNGGRDDDDIERFAPHGGRSTGRDEIR